MNYKLDLILIFKTAFSSWFLTRLILPYLKLNILDLPNKRSSHNRPKPSGGGISFVVIITLFSILKHQYDVLLILPLAFIGFVDDFKPLSAKVRYFAQLITSIGILLFYKYNSLNLQVSNLLLVMFILISITAIINFTNFMDGLDGLATGSMVIIFAVVAVKVSISAWLIVGALLGFLIFNWYPSKVFMGDGGSTFLGALFCIYLFKANESLEILGLLLVATPFFIDPLTCVLRRLINRQNIFQAHKLHLFQRLHQAGWSHAKVSTIYILSTLGLALIYLIFGINYLIVSTIIVTVLGYGNGV